VRINGLLEGKERRGEIKVTSSYHSGGEFGEFPKSGGKASFAFHVLGGGEYTSAFTQEVGLIGEGGAVGR